MLRQLVEGGRVLAMEERHVDVSAADGCEREEQDVAVDRVAAVDAVQFEFVAFGGKTLDRRQQVIASQRRDYLLDDTRDI